MMFDMPKEQNSIIKVIGVGGGGSNAVNHMFNQGITGVNFAICNTDAQALDASPVPTKIQLGPEISKGLGAGSLPEVGRQAALESLEEVITFLSKNTHMVFITAGMGGGTGTGAAPVIAKTAKEMGILTVAIVTLPFKFEGPKRKRYADEGLDELKQYVDSIIIISNDKVRTIYGDLKMREAFAKADNVLTTAAKGIAELITKPLELNVDFADVKTVMQNSGVALMGTACGRGNNRAIEAVTEALNSPLLSDNDVKGAKNVLFSVTYGNKAEISMDELNEITDYINNEVGKDTDIFWGHGFDETLDDELQITVVATGFNTKNEFKSQGDVNKISFHNAVEMRVESKMDSTVSIEQEIHIKPQDEPNEVKYETFIFENENPNSSRLNLHENEIELDLFVEKKFEDENFTITNDVLNKDSTAEVEDLLSFKTRMISDASIDNATIQQGKSRLQMLKDELKAYNYNKGTIAELENQPAFERRGIELGNTPHSSESQISNLGVSNNDGTNLLQNNNSFLWGNVD